MPISASGSGSTADAPADHRPLPGAALGAAADAPPRAERGGLRQPGRHRVLRADARPHDRRGRPPSRPSTRSTSATPTAPTPSGCARTRCARSWAATRSSTALEEHLGIGHDETTDDGVDHPRAGRVQRGLRLRARGDGQLGVLRQPDAASRRELVDRLRAGQAVAPDPRRRRRCAPSRRSRRVLAGFPDGHADEGVGAGDADPAGHPAGRRAERRGGPRRPTGRCRAARPTARRAPAAGHRGAPTAAGRRATTASDEAARRPAGRTTEG